MAATRAAAALLWGLLSCGAALAGCLDGHAESRLRLFCLAGALDGQVVDIATASLMDYSLKSEGYAAGLGLPGRVPAFSARALAYPVLAHDANVNGGNPDRPLVLGGLSFTGDEESLKRGGIVAGPGLFLGGRGIYGEGRYLDLAASASYARSQHGLGVARASASLCSRNHVARQWYADACADAARQERDLSEEETSGTTLGVARQFAAGGNSYHSAGLSARWHRADGYRQRQLRLEWGTLRAKGPWTSLGATLGEAVPGRLAARRSLSATLGTAVSGRALSATASYSRADGGRLLGVAREDATRSILVSYAVTPAMTLGLGYRDTDSSIDYFSNGEPVLSVQFRAAPVPLPWGRRER